MPAENQTANSVWKTLVNTSIVRTACIALTLMLPTVASGGPPTHIKIDTVPDKYMPSNLTILEPVSMQDFHFEVSPETLRARLVVDYTYPDELVYGRDDDRGGPRPSTIQLLGLEYDPAAHAVVYEAAGKQTVCANVEERKGLFGRHLVIKNTGSCVVSSQDAKHAEDNGWEIRRFDAIDTYFEVR